MMNGLRKSQFRQFRPFGEGLILLFLVVASGCATPLGSAIKNGDTLTMKELLAKGANINERNCEHYNAIQCAAIVGQIEAVKLLLAHGADINDNSHGLGTPLDLATRQGHENVVRFLLENGADPSIQNQYGHSPLQHAIMDGFPNIVRILQEAEYKKMAATHPTAAVPEKKKGQQPSPPTVEAPIKSDVDDPPAVKVQPHRNTYALVIGVEKYRQRLPNADYAVHDAKIVTEYLTRTLGYSEENVVTLTNEHAAMGDFVKYFEKWLSNNVEKGSSVFIYYSGHGAPNPKTGDAYLVPYDGDPSFIEQTGYPLRRLYSALEKLPAREIVLAMDACFSGAGGNRFWPKALVPW